MRVDYFHSWWRAHLWAHEGLETYLADWEEFLKTYKKKFETAEEEYFSGKREELPDMAQIFVKTMLKKYMNNRYNTNKNTENIMQ